LIADILLQRTIPVMLTEEGRDTAPSCTAEATAAIFIFTTAYRLAAPFITALSEAAVIILKAVWTGYTARGGAVLLRFTVSIISTVIHLATEASNATLPQRTLLILQTEPLKNAGPVERITDLPQCFTIQITLTAPGLYTALLDTGEERATVSVDATLPHKETATLNATLLQRTVLIASAVLSNLAEEVDTALTGSTVQILVAITRKDTDPPVADLPRSTLLMALTL